MTGMGSDGTNRLEAMKAKGLHILSQDEEKGTLFVMLGEAEKVGLINEQIPLD